MAPVLAVAAVGCSPGTSPQILVSSSEQGKVVDLSRDGSTYRVPDPLPSGPRGSLLAAHHDGPSSKLGGADRYTVLYKSSDLAGRDATASGVVLVPQGQPPEGGWPVVSWAHGTIGIADRCAPSQTGNLGYDEYADEVAGLVKAGYAVAATDYIGLGTPGPHLYMNRVEQGNAVADIVPAARQLVPSLGERWFAIGHSQGGAAALEASGAGSPASVVAVAPGGSADRVSVLLSGSDSTVGNERGPLYLTYLLLALSDADPDVHLSDLLTPEGVQTAQLVRDHACLSDPASIPPLSASMFNSAALKDSAFLSKLADYANPDRGEVRGPVLVITGEKDTDVPTPLTDSLVQALERKDSTVSTQVVPGADHDEALQQTLCEQLGFLAQHGGNQIPEGRCPARP